MQLVVVGDLHLRSIDSPFTLELPETWTEVDGVLVVGDVVDRRSQAIEVGREMFQQLNSLDVPVLAIPGNHDYHWMEDLVDEFTNVLDGHKTTVDIAGISIAGLGCERFDAGPEVTYPQFKATPSDWDEDELQALVDALHQDKSSAKEILTSGQSSARAEEHLQRYETQYNDLQELVAACKHERTTLLVHVPPFGSRLDRIAKHRSARGGLHWGSMALRNILQAKDITAVVSGHIHEREGTDTINGTFCLNAGLQSAHLLEIADKQVHVRETQGL